MLVVIEDNNSYYTDLLSGSVRLYHRAYVFGYPEGDFRPEGNTSRAETAAIFARILANYDEDSLKDVTSDFTDVFEDKWYAKYVSRLEGSIINGYPDGSFKPDGKITRAEFAAICVRYFEDTVGEIEKEKISFTDLERSHWAYEYIQKAVKQKYIGGYPDRSVKPDENITRAEVVTVVNRMLERAADKDFVDKNLSSLASFTDLKDKSYWAYYDIYEAANNHHLKKLRKTEYWIK